MPRIKNYQEYEHAVHRAVEIFNKGDLIESRKIFEDLAEYNFKNIQVHEKLTWILIKTGDLDKAIEEYNILLNLLKEQNYTLPDSRSFEEIIETLEDKEELEEKYEAIFEEEEEEEEEKETGPADSSKSYKDSPEGKQAELKKYKNTRLTIKLGLAYMAEGNYDKAEEILLKFQSRINKETPEKIDRPE